MPISSFSCTGLVFDRRNHQQGLEILRDCLKHCTFLAVDTEFSGTGEDRAVYSLDLDERYEAIRRLAATSAIFSVGIACFRAQDKGLHHTVMSLRHDQPDHKDEPRNRIPAACAYDVHILEFLFLCQDLFTVSGDTATFLAHHGMDFNRVFAYGIPYRRPTTTEQAVSNNIHDAATQEANQKSTVQAPREDAGQKQPSRKHPKMKRPRLHRPRNEGFGASPEPLQVLSVLLGCAKPVVLHNGLYDLMLMFGAFEAPLPPTIEGFMQCLLELCRGRFYDTRVLEDFVPARFFNCPSYLAYLFRKHERRWFQERLGVQVHFPEIVRSQSRPGPPQNEHASGTEAAQKSRVCRRYARFGYCDHGIYCRFSHNIDQIIDVDEELRSQQCEPGMPSSGGTHHRVDSADGSPRPDSHASDHISQELAPSGDVSEASAVPDAAAFSEKGEFLDVGAERSPGRGDARDASPRDEAVVGAHSSSAVPSGEPSELNKKQLARHGLPNNRFAVLDELDDAMEPAMLCRNLSCERPSRQPEETGKQPAGVEACDAPRFRCIAHSAGYDAFCTGYVFASMLALPDVRLSRVASFANTVFASGGGLKALSLRSAGSTKRPVLIQPSISMEQESNTANHP